MGLFGFLNFVQSVCPDGQGASDDGQGAPNDGQGAPNDSQGSASQQSQQSQSHVQSQRGRYQASPQSYAQPQNGRYEPSQQSQKLPGPRRTMYLMVYNARVNPAHWAILVPQQSSQTVGTIIHVVSSSNGGFEHEIRAYDEQYTRSIHQKLEIGKLDEHNIPRIMPTALAIDANGVGCNLPGAVVSSRFPCFGFSDLICLKAPKLQLPDLDDALH